MSKRECRDMPRLLSAYLDGETTREEHTRIQFHIGQCEDCRRLLLQYQRTARLLRNLPPVPMSVGLTESILSETVDAPPRRMFQLTSRMGYSLGAVAAIVLIFVVAGALLFNGYQRGVDPTVRTAQLAEQQALWPLHVPVVLEFNKEMNHESVRAAMGILPAAEEERLSQRWDGKTLIIGENTPFRPDTTYEIKISTEALDTYGKPLTAPFHMQFTTQSAIMSLETPTPTAEPTATPSAAPESTPVATVPPASAERESTRVPDRPDVQSPTTAIPTAPAQAVVTLPPNTGNNQPPTGPVAPTATEPRSVPTATDEPVPPTSTATTAPSATPTPAPTHTPLPTATVEPSPTPTIPVATATTAPLPTATPAAIPVVGVIGDVYWRDQSIQDRLGAPTSAATSFTSRQLDFQRGVMLTDASGESAYTLRATAGWDWRPVPPGTPPEATAGPGEGLWEPTGNLGLMWLSDPSLKDEIGYALAPQARSISATVQTFLGGRIIATPTTVYVIYADSTWDWFSV